MDEVTRIPSPSRISHLVTLANGTSFAAQRQRGTEPKMKFYLFASAKVASAAELGAVKVKAEAELDRIKAMVAADAKARAED